MRGRCRSLRCTRWLVAALVAAVTVVGAAVPAGAQQLVDAGKEGDGSGGLAFVLLAVMCAGIVAALFFMDRIRRRASDEEELRS